MFSLKKYTPSTALIFAGLYTLSGCVSIAPIEPVKNPPTKFRSDNVVAVEFLNPATVGLRCGERGTKAFGMPVFHAMACGNGKLITMPDPCLTFTGGEYASLLCDQRRRPVAVPAPVPEWQALLQPASYTPAPRPAPTPLKPRASASVKAEFVHPSGVLQRCSTRGLEVTFSEKSDLASCGDSEMLTVPNPCMILEAGWYPRTLCHEMAHANGWSMDHPGGSFLSDARAGVDPNDVPPPRAVLAALSSSAPLRPASASPAYLAFVAAQKPAAPLPEFETLPAVYAQLPVGVEGLASRAVVLEGQSAPDLGPDLGLSVLEYAAAHRSILHSQQAPALMTASLTGNALTLRPRLASVAEAPGLATAAANARLAPSSAILHQAAAAPQLRPAPPAPRPPAAVWLAAVTRERATGAAAFAVNWLAGLLPDDPATIEAIMARLAPETPPAPSVKPVLNRSWQQETEADPAAGV